MWIVRIGTQAAVWHLTARKAPEPPPESAYTDITEATAAKYREAERRLTGR